MSRRCLIGVVVSRVMFMASSGAVDEASVMIAGRGEGMGKRRRVDAEREPGNAEESEKHHGVHLPPVAARVKRLQAAHAVL
ncbi:MAG: hypothetical protein KF911_11055 [Pseudomonadales bacterium]|nr:hypothetical protein [Pseudomonadales bacterium]